MDLGGIITALIIILGIGMVFFGLVSRGSGEELEADLEKISTEDKDNNVIKAVSFKTAEDAIDGLVISKEIKYEISETEKGEPRSHKLILDHENRYLYYILLNKENMDESITYRKVPYSEIVQAAVIIDEVITSKSSLASKVGGTIAGGMLAGGVGAVVGGMNTKRKNKSDINEIELKVIINDKNNPSLNVRFNKSPISKDKEIKKIKSLAEEWKSVIDLIINEENQKFNSSSKKQDLQDIRDRKDSIKIDKFEELTKYKKLLDEGTITEEEFQRIKVKLLDL